MAGTNRVRQKGNAGNGVYRRQTTNRSSEYVTGNTVRKIDVVTQVQEPKKQLSTAARKNRDKAVYMNLGYVLFLTIALVVAGVVLIGYIRLQSDITARVKHISQMESILNSLKTANDEEYSRIESSIDLEEIKRIAITELGMTYAKEGQIVTVPDGGSDYVRQLQDISQ